MSHAYINGYGVRPAAGPGIGPMRRQWFLCSWVTTDANGNERVCGARFDSTSPNAEVCPKHRPARDAARSREYQRQAVARRKAVGR